MKNLSRRRAPNPYDHLPAVSTFTVASEDFVDGEPLGPDQAGEGERVSPQLSWTGAPEGTRSFAVTCFDADAPSPSGIWHWVLVDLPADVSSLPRGIAGGVLPGEAFELRHDGGGFGFLGAAPPPGDMPHRYYFAVHALAENCLGVDHSTSVGVIGAMLTLRSIGRGVVHATYERPLA